MAASLTGTFAAVVKTIIDGTRKSLVLVETAANNVVNLQGNASGHPYVEISGGTVTATVTGVATAALQTALNAIVAVPTIPTQITASDATDVSTLTTKGLLVETAGDLAIRGTGAPSTTVTITVVAGQYVPIACSRVMAASTATCVGLS